MIQFCVARYYQISENHWAPPGDNSFSSPEATLLLVSTKNCDLWPDPTPEVQTSRHSERMLRVKPGKSDWFWSQSIVFTKPFKTRMSLAGPGQRSRFLVLTERSAASGDENGDDPKGRCKLAPKVSLFVAHPYRGREEKIPWARGYSC